MDRVATVVCLNLPSWVMRFKFDQSRTKDDLKWTAFLSLSVFRHELLQFVIQYIWRYAWGIPVFLAIYLASIVGVFDQGLEQSHSSEVDRNLGSLKGQPLKPLLLPCRTSHTRFFPKKHSFSYSYLFVGIPVGWRGSVGSILSADAKSPSEGKEQIETSPDGLKAWFSVEAADYLERGSHSSGLQGKLQGYLRSQGENLDLYPHAYLVTAPRFLAYSFNPVSFWYLYSQEMELKAMILEVNNTFDERRIYFLKGSSLDYSFKSSNEKEEDQQISSVRRSDDSLDPQEAKSIGESVRTFTDTWYKDFHVSPFNSRKGSYALSASDPLLHKASTKGPINNVINLNSSKAHPKLVARVYSTGEARDPATFSPWDTIKFITNWWWVGLVTFPRIVREAGKLFFRKKLYVWYRPEVSKGSIARQATDDEIVIGKCFSKFIRDQVEHSDLTVLVRFYSALPEVSKSEIYIPISRAEKSAAVAHVLPSEKDILEFKVLTPLFYDMLARYAHISEFLRVELLEKDDEDRTLWTSDPSKLLDIFCEKGPSKQHSSKNSRFDRVRWSFLRKLRGPRSGPSISQSSKGLNSQTAIQNDIRSYPFSLLDKHVMNSRDVAQAQLYRRTVTKILISEYITLGIPQLLTAFDTAVRLLLCYISVIAIYQSFGTEYLATRSGYLRFGRSLLRCNALHLWRLLESYL